MAPRVCQSTFHNAKRSGYWKRRTSPRIIGALCHLNLISRKPSAMVMPKLSMSSTASIFSIVLQPLHITTFLRASRALEAFEQTLQQCHHCQRRFLPKPYLHHQKGCTAVNPAKPAGTGLIPISLTNRLVPGAIAGSMHGNARTHVPLRLCKPAEKSKLANSVKMSRPVSARPVWTGAGGDDPSLFDVRDPGQSSNWNNNLCNETENCRKLTNPRPFSVHKGNGYDDKSQLADTFENLWQAHSRADNLRLPRRRSGGAQEWCSQGETNTSLSSRRDANPRPKSALSSQNRRPLSATCHDFQGHLLRDSRQAECNENCTLPESKCTGESREQRCHL